MVNISTLHDKRVEEQDLSAADLTLEADTNESLIVPDFGISGAGADEIVEVTIGEEFMVAVPAENGAAELMLEETIQQQGMSFIGWLRRHDFPVPTLKVPEGETLTITAPGGAGTATLLYEEISRGQEFDGQPGAPSSKTRWYPISGEETESIAAGTTETFEVATTQQPAQADDFPFGTDVPSNREYDLLAVAVELDPGSGANVTLDSFRFISEEQRWIARDSAFVDPALADYPDAPLDTYPLTFPETPTFTPGDELDVEVTASNAGGGAEDAIVDVTFVWHRRAV